MSIYQIDCKTLQGETFNWETFKGKKLLIVNTASECGYTPQYAQLQELHEELGGDDFAIIGVPSNDFGSQEPGSAKEIETFCQKNYGVAFQMLEKMKVLGENAHPLYQRLQEETKSEVAWNFTKFLIDKKGTVLKMLPSGVSPLDEQILNWING